MGHPSHGVLRTFWYARRIQSGATRINVQGFQNLHEQPVIETDTDDSAGYAGFIISNGVDVQEIACDFDL